MREPSIVRIARLQTRRRPGLRTLAFAGLLTAVSTVHANVIFVAAGAVGSSSSACSLVDAINAANNNTATGACPAGDDHTGGGDVIVLAAGTYKIGSVDNDWYGPNGLPPISSKITIVGDPKGSVIMRSSSQGTQAFRLFFVSGGQSLTAYNPPTDFSTLPSRGTLTLVNLTLENGLAQGGDGGASALGSGGGGLGAGGAIYNQGALTLQGVTLLGNQAVGGDAGGSSTTNNGDPGGGGGMAGGGDGFGNGGGFNTNGSWPDSTTPSGEFGNGGSASQAGGVGGGGGSNARGGYGGGGGGGSSVTAFGGFGGGFGGLFHGGGAGMGGAIFNDGGVLSLTNCTLTSNTAGAGSGVLPGIAEGGAIFNLDGSVTVTFSTLANNTLAGATGTTGDGGAIYSEQLASPGSPAADASGTASVSVKSSILYGTELNTTDPSSGDVTSSAATDCVNSSGSFGGSPNVIGATSASCFVSGDSTSSPFLLALGNYGGPTQTMAIIASFFSSAWNTGSSSGAPSLDQRGYLRDALPDMGAYESSNVAKAPPGFAGLQALTLIAGNNASLAWFNLSGNDATQPALSVSVLSSNATVLPAVNLALSSNCGADLAHDTCNLSLLPTATKTGDANVTLIASNGYGQTGYGTFPVTVIPPAPVAKSASVSVASGQTLNGSLTATDALNVSFTYAIVNQPAHGKLKLSAPSYTYTPDAGYLGGDSFTWKANDGSSDSNVATVSITVTLPPPPAGAPTVSDMTLSTPVNTTLTNTLQAAGASLSFAIATKPAHGSVKLTSASTGAFTYAPSSGYSGTDSFTFTAENTTLKATSNPATVHITVGTVSSGSGGSSSGGSSSGGSSSGGSSGGGSGSGSGNNSVAPLASAMTLSTYAGVALSGVLTASDAAGNALEFSVTKPAHGSLKLGNATSGAFIYTPAAGYSGSDSFSFTATDTVTSLSSTASVSLTINTVPVSSKAVPLASNATFTTYVDTPIDGSLSASDAAGNPLSYVLSAAPAHGTVVITAASGAFTYTPSTGYAGNDSFSFTATDAVTGITSTAASVALTMDAVPTPSATTTAPVANDASLSTYEAVPIANASLSASDALGNAVTYAIVTGPLHGALTGPDPNTGVYTYAPTAGYIGSDSFTFQATDSVNAVPSNTATITISVGALPPPAPVAANLAVSTYENIPVGAVLPASDGAGDPMTFAINTAPAHGATSGLNTATGAFTYTPTASFIGSDTLSFTAAASNGTSAPANVNFSVITNPVVANPSATPAPLASNGAITVYENTTLSNQQLTGASAVAGHVLTFAVATQPSHGTLVVNASGGYSYQPDANYVGADAFSFTVTDTGFSPNTISSPAAVVVNVAATPTSVPPLSSSASFSLFTGQSLAGALVAVDSALDAVSYSAVQPSHGTVSVTAGTGAFVYTPNAGFVGSDSFSFTAIDNVNGAASTPALVSLTVQALPLSNVAPLANGGTLALYADQPATGTLAAVDAAQNPLSYAPSAQPTHGKLQLDASTGAYTYTPDAGYTGADSFSFTATDGVTRLTSNTATVDITVAAVPLQAVAPLANNVNLTLYAGQTYVGMLSAIDVNGNPMNYTISAKAKHGVATVDVSTGAFTYTPTGGYSGPDSFAYTAVDKVSQLKSSAATVSLDITPAPPGAVHHGGPGRGAYGQVSLLLLGLLVLWRRRLLPALGACGLLWSISVAADNDQAAPPTPLPADAWYVAGQASLIRPDSSRDAATHGPRGWGILAGKQYGDFSFELSAAYHADNPKSLDGVANWKTFGFDGLWYFTHRKSQAFSPYADGGLGFAEEYFGDNSTQRKPYLAAGVGFDSQPWTLPVFLRTELQLQHVFSGYNDLILSFDVGFHFGGSTPPPPPLALPDASPQDQYPMAWCTEEGGQPQETDEGWVCYLPGGRTEAHPPVQAPVPATVTSPTAVTYAQPPAAY